VVRVWEEEEERRKEGEEMDQIRGREQQKKGRLEREGE